MRIMPWNDVDVAVIIQSSKVECPGMTWNYRARDKVSIGLVNRQKTPNNE
jgi:hypothetical protein